MRPLRIASAAGSSPAEAQAFFDSAHAQPYFDALRATLPEATDEEVLSWLRSIAKTVVMHRRDDLGSFEELFAAGHAALLRCIAQMRADGNAHSAPRSRLARFGLWWVRQGVLVKLAELQPPPVQTAAKPLLTDALIGLPEEVLDGRALENLFTLAARGEAWATDTLLRHYRPAIARLARQLAPAGTDYRAAVEAASRLLRHSIPQAGLPLRIGWMLEHDVRKVLKEETRIPLSPAQIARLNLLNNALHPLGQQLVDEARRLHAEYRQAIERGEGFAQDYELEIEVSYFAPPDFGDPVYEARTFAVFPEDADHGEPLLTDPTDWKPWHTYPDLDRPYCYILHDLLDHSPLSLERVCEVEEVWGEVKVWGQRAVRLTKEENDDSACANA